jgi:hypothetical protein
METAVHTRRPRRGPWLGATQAPRRHPARLSMVALLMLAGPAAYADEYTVEPGATTGLETGSILDLDCNFFNIDGTFLTGAGSVQQSNDVTIQGTLDGGSGILHIEGDWFNAGTFIPRSSTVSFEGLCKIDLPNHPVQFHGGPTTFCNLDLTNNDATYLIPAGNKISIAPGCQLTLSSNPNNLKPAGGGTSTIQLGQGATCVIAGDGPCPASVNGVQIRGITATAIPSLSDSALILLSLLLAGLAGWRGRLNPRSGAAPGIGPHSR